MIEYIFSYLNVYEQAECSRITKCVYTHCKKNILLTYGPPLTLYLKKFGIKLENKKQLYQKCLQFCAIKKYEHNHKYIKRKNYLIEYIDKYLEKNQDCVL
tara:strand:- start:831 stop:1130 length:300 start_codon:yes stop_codon:yes gene_type:complete